jgi:GNAT superfamily N-acetyltransferase
MNADTPGRELEIRSARAEDAAGITEVALTTLDWSRLYELGAGFSTLLNRHISTSEHAICEVAVKDGIVEGFLQGTFDGRALYRQFLVRHGWRAALILAPSLFRPRRAATIWRCLTYFPDAHPDDPPAELLSMGVLPDLRGTGVAKRLLERVVERFRAAGADRIKCGTIDVKNESSNQFFQRAGATFVRTEELYDGAPCNVYVLSLAPTDRA